MIFEETSEHEDQHEPDWKDYAGIFVEGFESWARALGGATSDENRLKVFAFACTEAVSYVGKGLAKPDAIDALFDMAHEHGLVEKAGADKVNEIIAKAFEPPAQPNGNGQYHETEDPGAGMEAPQPGQQQQKSKRQQQAPPTLQPFPFIRAAEFDGQTAPQRRWLVHDRIPMRNVTLLSGDGATGKTTIALQLAVNVARKASDWLQNVIDETGPVMFFTAEEEMSEVHFRLEQIVNYYRDLNWTDLAELHVFSLAENDAILAAPHRTTILAKTDKYTRLELNISAIKPKLVILESVADLFAGNEIDRSQVRKFVSLLRELAIKHDCAIMILSHPSVSGLATGTGLSGSTQWNNAVRSRMYFKTIKADDEFDEQSASVLGTGSDFRELQYLKNNRAKQGDSIKLMWTNGLFLPEPKASEFEQAAQNAKADDVFMSLLRKFISTEQNVSANKGPTYAPSVFAGEKEAKVARLTSKALTTAMERLLADKRIDTENFGPTSKRRSRLVICPSTI